MLQKQGRQGYGLLRDRRGDYYFKETYVFVTSFEGREVVNPAFPMLEGRSVINTVDAKGKAFVRAYISALREQDSAWVSYQWPKPGSSAPVDARAGSTSAKIGTDTPAIPGRASFEKPTSSALPKWKRSPGFIKPAPWNASRAGMTLTGSTWRKRSSITCPARFTP